MISSKYNNPAIKQLAEQQVKYAPREVKLEQISRAESFSIEYRAGAGLSLSGSLQGNHKRTDRKFTRIW